MKNQVRPPQVGLGRVHEHTTHMPQVVEGVKGRADPLLGAHQGGVVEVIGTEVNARGGGQMKHKGVDG